MNQKKKSNIWTVARKEFARFFKDKGMVISILLPGIMIYVMYSFMGGAITNMFSTPDDFVANVYMVNEPESLAPVFKELPLNITETTDAAKIEEVKNGLQNKKSDVHALLVFPKDFDAQISDDSAAGTIPNIEIYYNSASTDSDTTYKMIFSTLDTYEDTITNLFDINKDVTGSYDKATEKDSSSQMFASMLPFLMMIFLFSGCMSVAPEAIAGEKERGTIATLLITPMKRSELAIGKIIALGCISLLSGMSSFIGTFASLPKLMAGAGDVSMTIYGVGDFFMLFGVILSTVLVIVGLICVLSAFAKSTKQAGTFVLPLMLVCMGVGITAMFGTGAATDTVKYLIPLYSSVQSMIGVFLLDYSTVNVLTCICSNLVYVAVCTYVLSKMFNNEKIMFNK